jgi:hypothetical protein
MPTTIVEDFVTTLDMMFWGMLYPTLAVCPIDVQVCFWNLRSLLEFQTALLAVETKQT